MCLKYVFALIKGLILSSHIDTAGTLDLDNTTKHKCDLDSEETVKTQNCNHELIQLSCDAL